MIGQETREVERKTTAILKVLSDSVEPLGSRIICRRIKEQGVDLSERAVRRSAAIDLEHDTAFFAFVARIIGFRNERRFLCVELQVVLADGIPIL